MDLISVIVPIYNVEEYLDKCVTSIVEQTHQNLEIILVDDGSPDNCPYMCDSWAKKDSRIRVIHKKNGGLSDARNAGMKIVTGDYVAFVDSDDWIEKDFLSVLLCVLKEEHADIAECGVCLVNSNDEVLSRRGIKEEKIILNKKNAMKRLITEDGIYQTVWNKLYKRALLKDILFEVGKCHEDEFWTYQVFDRIDTMVAINCSKYYYLQREGSIMGKGYSIKRLDGLQARLQRTQYLEKYEDIWTLAKQQLWYSMLFHYQNGIYYLSNHDDRKKVISEIEIMMKKVPLTIQDRQTLSPTYRCWFVLFSNAPYVTARIRNFFKIGL